MPRSKVRRTRRRCEYEKQCNGSFTDWRRVYTRIRKRPTWSKTENTLPQNNDSPSSKHDRLQIKHRCLTQQRRLHFADYSVCDVRHYHDCKMANLVRQIKQADSPTAANALQNKYDKATFKWIEFECQFYDCAKQQWQMPSSVCSTPADAPRGTVLSYFAKRPTGNDLHRRLISEYQSCVLGWCKETETKKNTRADSSSSVSSVLSKYQCQTCKTDLQRRRFELFCPTCGQANEYIDPKDRHFEELDSVGRSGPAYKRKNHLNDWLVRVQAGERQSVPARVVDTIKAHFAKWNIGCEDAHYSLVRTFLKASGYQRYFDNISQIVCILNKRPPIKFTKEQLTRIRQIFDAVQEPFHVYKPRNRKNFLSYSFVLYKICELMDLDDFLPSFPLLKSRGNLLKADTLWKQICQHCDYEFIPTS